jgi:H+/Cl- antiporter ClcA
MRFVIVVLALLGLGMVSGVTTPALAAAIDSGYAFVLEQQPGQNSIDIDVDSGSASWANPLWIGIGGVALLLLAVIVALAMRGGGTTVIKE